MVYYLTICFGGCASTRFKVGSYVWGIDAIEWLSSIFMSDVKGGRDGVLISCCSRWESKLS